MSLQRSAGQPSATSEVAGAGTGSSVIDVTDATFEAEVIERSKTTPVVVDFWAEWCGPCRQLGPVLEKSVAARDGEVVLAKVDVDSNPGLSQAFKVQGIPAVKAFKDGKLAGEFVGAQPPPAVERFLDTLVPSEADRLTEAGDEASLRKAVELDPRHAAAAVPLARILLARGESAEALDLLEGVTGDFQAEGLISRIRLVEGGDPEVIAAVADLDAGRTEAGLDRILAAIPDAAEAQDDLRRIVVGVLDEAGPSSELAQSYRRKLAQALY